MNILVRNLSRETTEDELWRLFLPFGKVRSLTLVMDPLTGKSKGFGFVDMPKEIEAMAAIGKLNGSEVRGEKIRVKVTSRAYRPPTGKTAKTPRERFDFRGRAKPGRKPGPCWRGANRRNTGRKYGK